MTSSEQSAARWWALHPIGALLALFAAVWHAALMTSATNDNFLHLTLAQQWLAGDWPVRDFFEHAWVLQYALSAAAQLLAGTRLLGEAIVVGIAWGVSVYLVFGLVRRETGYAAVAALAGILLIVAGARGYSYPKGIVYAGAAWLWWQYVRAPTPARVAGFGAWAAVAFYWRPDHGVYVAVSLVLALLAAHGLRAATIRGCALGGAVMLTLVAPFLLYVQLTVGLPGYVQTAAVQAQVEHLSHGTHQWPLLRFRGSLFAVEPAGKYAPVVTVRWTAASSPDERQEVRTRYDLERVARDDGVVEQVRLSERAVASIRALINEPIVEDTAGIDRSSGTLLPATWPAAERRAFNHAWLRVRLLPSLDDQTRASELAVAWFHLLPIAVMIGAPWIRRHLPGPVTSLQLIAFAVFALLVDIAMLRDPFPARMADAVVLSAVVLAFCIAAPWRAAGHAARVRGALLRGSAVAVALAVTAAVAGASRFTARLDDLAGHWRSPGAARAAWGAVYDELAASPPLRYFVGRSARFSLRLAAYVRECVPPSDRLLVLWFEPEIYYYSERLMAQRHLGFAPAWAALEHEQRMTLEKVTRFAPPLALVRRSALEDQARATYPGVVAYVEREYVRAASVEDGGEEYWIFTRRDRPPLRGFGPQNWPCHVRESAIWSQVGSPAP